MRDLNAEQLLKLYIDYTAYRDKIIFPDMPLSVERFFNLNKQDYLWK